MQPRQRERRRNVEVQAMIEAKLKWVDDIFNPLCEGADKVANARAVVAKKLGKTLEIGTKKPEPPMSERIASAISTRLENLAGDTALERLSRGCQGYDQAGSWGHPTSTSRSVISVVNRVKASRSCQSSQTCNTW